MYKTSSLLILMALSASALAGTPVSGEKLKQLASGNTVTLYSVVRNETVQNYYAADGTALFFRSDDGKKMTGTWRVTDSGEWCVHWSGNKDRCGLLLDNGDGTYDRQEDGSIRSVWKKIESGNTIP